MAVNRELPPASGLPSSGAPRQATSRAASAPALDLVGLTPLMQLTRGAAEVSIGLIGAPVDLDHPALSRGHVHELAGGTAASLRRADILMRMQGTFIAGVLCAVPESAAPAICPECTLLVRPILTQGEESQGLAAGISPDELARAIVDCVDAGARILNLSLAVLASAADDDRALMHALDHAAQSGVIAVVAAGNLSVVGSSLIARQPWIIAVVPCDLAGRPRGYTNVGNAVGRRALMAPGDRISSLGVSDEMRVSGGPDVAAAFVTGAVALLWSLFPRASAGQVRTAVAPAQEGARRRVEPPLLDAWQAYLALASTSPLPLGRARVASPR